METEDSRLSSFMQEILINEKKVSIRCRICHEWVGESEQLCSPCFCRGELQHVHEDCLIKWIFKTGNQRCEFCGHRIRLRRVYKKSRPKRQCLWVYAKEVGANVRRWILFASDEVVGLALFHGVFACCAWVVAPWVWPTADQELARGVVYLQLYILGVVASLVAQKGVGVALVLSHLLLRVQRKKPHPCLFEDAEFSEWMQVVGEEPEKKDDLLTVVGVISRLGMFANHRFSERIQLGQTKTLSPDETCAIFAVIVMEEENLLSRRDQVDNLVQMAAANFRVLEWIVLGYQRSRIVRALVALLTHPLLLLGICECWMGVEKGLSWMEGKIVAWAGIGLEGQSGMVFSIGLIGLGLESLLELSLAVIVIGGLLLILWMLQRPLGWLDKLRVTAYALVKVVVLKTLEWVALPWCAGGTGVALVMAAIDGKGIGSSTARVLGVTCNLWFVGTGHGLIFGMNWLLEQLVVKVYRQGLFYWMLPLQGSGSLEKMMRERLGLSLRRIALTYLQVLALVIALTAGVGLARMLLFTGRFFGKTGPVLKIETFGLKDIQAWLYLGAIGRMLFLESAQGIVVLLLQRTFAQTKAMALRLRLGSFLFDIPLDSNHVEENDPAYLKYLPACANIEYREEEIAKRQALEVTLAEKQFYFDYKGERIHPASQDRFLDAEKDNCSWSEIVALASRPQLLYNPSFLLYHIPSFFAMKLTAYWASVLLLLIVYSLVLMVSACGVWAAVAGLVWLAAGLDLADYVPFAYRVFFSVAVVGFLVKRWQTVRQSGRIAWRLKNITRIGLRWTLRLLVWLPISLSIIAKSLLLLFPEIIQALMPATLARTSCLTQVLLGVVAINTIITGTFIETEFLRKVAFFLVSLVLADALLFKTFIGPPRLFLRLLLITLPFLTVYTALSLRLISRLCGILSNKVLSDLYVERIEVISKDHHKKHS
ncbi:hypothetical protein NEHOM01_0646 [Nematocida homosporus]|uniref:uncharacterized protein n=1 Tax=Nematocida homosporus TaxID=1912981 RepID=UPI00221F17AE|nr:uncharacterized protein NEHOM01_0646 [Nematocida homosporus]KAI5185141.1 hypothetical protein NEHOM01_0646 [Nematocida homosporus]